MMPGDAPLWADRGTAVGIEAGGSARRAGWNPRVVVVVRRILGFGQGAHDASCIRGGKPAGEGAGFASLAKASDSSSKERQMTNEDSERAARISRNREIVE